MTASEIRFVADGTTANPRGQRGGAARGGWQAFLARRSALAALCLLAGFVLMAIFESYLVTDNPLRIHTTAFLPPSSSHWFGTDNLGHDVRDMVIVGARSTLLVGFLSAALATLIGVTIGALSGFAGGWLDDILMRVVEVVEIVPRFFLAVLLAAMFGPSVTVIVLLLGCTFWPDTARLLRAEILSLRQRDFVLAERALGLSEFTILRRHILPQTSAVVVITAALQVGSAVLVQAGLAFLGLADTATVSWGAMLQSAQNYIALAWWPAVFPGVAISLLVISTNMAADGMLAAFSTGAGGRHVGAQL